MSEPRDINQFIDNASIVVITGDYGINAKMSFLHIPEIHDEVSLDTDEGYSMIVEVTEIFEDGETFIGKVIHGYHPEAQENTIEVGEIVCFAREKIHGIHKKK
jgi:hypothetical protein